MRQLAFQVIIGLLIFSPHAFADFATHPLTDSSKSVVTKANDLVEYLQKYVGGEIDIEEVRSQIEVIRRQIATLENDLAAPAPTWPMNYQCNPRGGADLFIESRASGHYERHTFPTKSREECFSLAQKMNHQYPNAEKLVFAHCTYEDVDQGRGSIRIPTLWTVRISEFGHFIESKVRAYPNCEAHAASLNVWR